MNLDLGRRPLEVSLLAVERELDAGDAELVGGFDAHRDAGLLHGLVELGDLEHRRLRVNVHAETLGALVAGAVGGGDDDLRPAVGQVGLDDVLARGVGVAARLDGAVDDGDGSVGLGLAAEGGRIGVDLAPLQAGVEGELRDAGVDDEVPVFADVVAEDVGARGAEVHRVLTVGEVLAGDGERVAVLAGDAGDVLAVEGDGDALQLAQAVDLEDERGGRVLDIRVGTRRDRRDARHAVELPADDGRKHTNRRDDDVRPAAAAAWVFALIDVIRRVRHGPFLEFLDDSAPHYTAASSILSVLLQRCHGTIVHLSSAHGPLS